MALRGKNAYITGAVSGIGYVTAKDLLNEGISELIIIDCNEDLGYYRLKYLSAEYPRSRVYFRKVDVTDEDEVKASFDYAKEKMKVIDIVVNAAGMFNNNKWKEMIDVNLKGVANCTMNGLREMSIENGGRGGIIVNMGSIGGVYPLPFSPMYTASKYGVIGLTRCYGSPFYYKKTTVKVVAVCPTAVDSPMIANRVENTCCEFVNRDEAVAGFKGYDLIRPEEVSKAILNVIQDGTNGSIWEVWDDKPKQCVFPDSLITSTISEL